MPDDLIIGFSSKELFLELNRKIDVLMELSHKKADKADVDGLENRVIVLERDGAKTTAVDANRGKVEEMGRTIRMQWVGILVSILLGVGEIMTLTHGH